MTKNRKVTEEPKTATEAQEQQEESTGRAAITNKVDCWKAVNAVKGEKFTDDDLLKAWDDGITAIGDEDGYDDRGSQASQEEDLTGSSRFDLARGQFILDDSFHFILWGAKDMSVFGGFKI